MGDLLGSGPSLNTNAGDTYRSTLNNIGSQYGNIFNQQNGMYQGDQANANRADTAYLQYLNSDQATNPYNAQQVAKATQNDASNAARATANTDASLAQRGVGGAGSSAAAGAAAAISEGLAANNTNAANMVAQENIAQHNQNLGTAANFANGVAGQDFGRATGALGDQAGINTGLMNNADQIAMDKYNEEVARGAAQDQFWGALGSAGINAWGASAGSGSGGGGSSVPG